MNRAEPLENLKQHLKESEFSRMFVASIGLHLAIVLSFTIKTFFFPTDAIDYQSAIQVDIVALPEKGKELPPVMEETKPDEKPPENVAEKPVEKPVEKPKEAAIPEKPKLDLKAKKKEKK